MKKMSTAIIVIVSVVGATLSVISGEISKEACDSWANLKRTAEAFSGVRLTCVVNDFCTGISCSGSYKDLKGRIDAHLQHCVHPISVEVMLSVPKLNLNNWSHVYLHGERVRLPRTKYTASPEDGDDFLEINLQQTDERTAVLGVSIVEHSSSRISPLNVVLIKNETLKLPPCDGKGQEIPLGQPGVALGSQHVSKLLKLNRATATLQDERPCDLSVVDPCGPGEICDQIGVQETQGACHCLPGNIRNADGICTPDPAVPSTTGNSITEPPQNDPKSQPGSSQTAIQIAVPIVLIVLIATLVVLAHKFRWISKIRARFQRPQVYEEMVIDGDEVSSIHSQGSNPVA